MASSWTHSGNGADTPAWAQMSVTITDHPTLDSGITGTAAWTAPVPTMSAQAPRAVTGTAAFTGVVPTMTASAPLTSGAAARMRGGPQGGTDDGSNPTVPFQGSWTTNPHNAHNITYMGWQRINSRQSGAVVTLLWARSASGGDYRIRIEAGNDYVGLNTAPGTGGYETSAHSASKPFRAATRCLAPLRH